MGGRAGVQVGGPAGTHGLACLWQQGEMPLQAATDNSGDVENSEMDLPAGAAYEPAHLAAATGTYVGCMFVDYMSLLRVALQQQPTGMVMTGMSA